MHLALASDHAGFALKSRLIPFLEKMGHAVLDLGAASSRPVDYPDFAEKLCAAILRGRAQRGILICGSGVGASIAANKAPRIRAGLCHDTYSARQGVEHDDMNVLVLGARVVGEELARELVRVFLEASFSGEKRHSRRLQKLRRLEEKSWTIPGTGKK